MSALLAAQQSTLQAVNVQRTAVAVATLQSVYATQTAVAGIQQAAAAATATAATGTAAAMTTRDVRDGIATLQAATAEAPAQAAIAGATVTRLHLLVERDMERAAQAELWSLLWLAAVAGLIVAMLLLLYSLAARRLAESRIIRDGRGDVVAVRHGGVLEWIGEPELPALPAVVGEVVEAPEIVRINGVRRERIFQYDDDVALHWRDMVAVFTQAQVRELRRRYEQGDTGTRRDTSSAGLGFDKLPDGGLGSGSVYNTTRAVLLGLEYIDDTGQWTHRGVVEFLGTRPLPPGFGDDPNAVQPGVNWPAR